jgi:hypothetical protein
MNELDQKIREALAAEESDLLAQFDEPSLPREVLETFQGRRRWLVVLVFVMTFVYVGLAIFTAIRFFQAESMRGMIGWATGFGLSMTIVAVLKVWYWIELAKNGVAREVKRVELQLARLAAQLQRPG